MTSRTSVSPKSTIDSSSRRSSRSIRPSCSPASRYACAASPSAASSSGVTASVEVDVCRSRRSVAMMPTSSSVIGLNAPATIVNDGSTAISTRSGSWRTMSSGMRCSKRNTNPAIESSRTSGSLRSSTPVHVAKTITVTVRMTPISRRAGTKSSTGSSRYGPRPAARPFRSTVSRSDSLISALKAASMCRCKSRRWRAAGTGGSLIARPARSARPAGRRGVADALRRAPSGRCPFRGRSRRDAAARAVPARATRWIPSAPPRAPGVCATPRAITMSPRKADGLRADGLRARRETTARRLPHPSRGRCGSACGCARRGRPRS